MTRWQKIVAMVSVLWLIGLPIWLVVHSKSLSKIGEVSLKTRFASKRGEFSSNGPQSRCSARGGVK